MDIANATNTMITQMQTQQMHAEKINGMVKDQIEQQGEQVLNLIQSASPAPTVSAPQGNLGQNINTFA